MIIINIKNILIINIIIAITIMDFHIWNEETTKEKKNINKNKIDTNNKNDISNNNINMNLFFILEVEVPNNNWRK